MSQEQNSYGPFFFLWKKEEEVPGTFYSPRMCSYTKEMVGLQSKVWSTPLLFSKVEMQ